jgi:hypothetical protein
LYPGELAHILLFARRATGQDHVKHSPAHAFHRKSASGSIQLYVRSVGARDALGIIDEALAIEADE